jgi:hypothetical protein
MRRTVKSFGLRRNHPAISPAQFILRSAVSEVAMLVKGWSEQRVHFNEDCLSRKQIIEGVKALLWLLGVDLLLSLFFPLYV